MTDAKQTVDIRVYTSPDCQFCHLVKSYLQTQKVPFAEIDISADPAAGQELLERTGLAALPVTLFGDQNFVVGFDRAQIDGYLRDYGWL